MVVLLLSMSALSGLLVWQRYEDELRAAQARAESAAETVAAHMRWVGETAFQALRRIEDGLGDHTARFAADSVGDLDATLPSLPIQASIWVFNANGDGILSNRPASEPINVSDRTYFNALRNGDEWHISPWLTGRATNRPMFVIARRIEREGKFLGVAAIGIPADLLAGFWSKLDLGSGSTVGLIRDDGWVVARHPAPEVPLDLSKHELFTEHLPKAPSGSYQSSVSPADGVARLVGYYRVEGLPLVAVVGISRDAVLARLWLGFGSAAIVAVPIALALLGSSFWVAVLLRRYDRQRLELAGALEQNRMLFSEIHHRVKNNLTMVLSLIHMHPVSREVKRDIQAQISAMAAVHEQFYTTERFGTIDLSAYIRRLVDSLRLSAPDTVRVTCELVEMEVVANEAMPLGLIINEAVINAIKHGFPEGRAGTVTVGLERLPEDRARITVRDDGVGFNGGSAAEGTGSKLITRLCRQIGADCSYRQDGGVIFTLCFRVSYPPGMDDN